MQDAPIGDVIAGMVHNLEAYSQTSPIFATLSNQHSVFIP